MDWIEFENLVRVSRHSKLKVVHNSASTLRLHSCDCITSISKSNSNLQYVSILEFSNPRILESCNAHEQIATVREHELEFEEISSAASFASEILENSALYVYVRSTELSSFHNFFNHSINHSFVQSNLTCDSYPTPSYPTLSTTHARNHSLYIPPSLISPHLTSSHLTLSAQPKSESTPATSVELVNHKSGH